MATRWRILIWGVVLVLLSTLGRATMAAPLAQTPTQPTVDLRFPFSLFSSPSSTPSVVTERWGANSTAEYAGDIRDTTLNGLYPDWTGDGDELSIRSGGGFDAWALLYFDVSNLAPETVVRSARLRLSLYSHVAPKDVWESVHQILDPDALGLWSESQATFNERQPGVPWSNSGASDLTTVIGPELDRFYLGNLVQWRSAWVEWDVTQAVRDWVADPAANQGLLLPHIEGGLYTAPSRENEDADRRPYLEITYEGPNPNRPPQVTGVQAVHRSGQTFVTWNEIGSGNPEERYRVYRHTAPITAANLDDAILLAEIEPGSGYYAHEVEGCSAGGGCSPIGQSRFIIEDDGEPLPEGVGLFVYTVQISEQLSVNSKQSSLSTDHVPNSFGLPLITDYRSLAVVSYYAVSSVVEGNENRQDFDSNTAGPITESEATPRPVRVWTNDTNTGWVYTQFMDYHHWNPIYEGYAYNFYVGVPPGYDPDGDPWPLLVQLHAYTGSYRLPAASSAGTDYDWPVIQVFPDDRSNTWWYGFGELFGHEAPLRHGLIVNYTEQRLEQIIDWVISQFNVDLNRIYLWGGSMGGSGTLLFGLRHGDLFAAIYAESGMTNAATSGDAGGANWVTDVDERWGTPEENIPTNHGPGIWDWYNLQDWVRDNPGTELPFLADHHGQNDNTVDWETQGLPWYPALESGRHGFVGVFDNASHNWPGFVADSNVFTLTDFNFRRDESFPALSNASNSDGPATTTGCRNCRIEWSSSWNDFAGPPVDTADRYEVVLRTTDGSNATVDVTPRRLQNFVVTPGAEYAWQNRRVSDNGLVASGTVVADGDSLVTVLSFQVTGDGSRLILEPTGVVVPTATATPTATTGVGSPTTTPTPTATPDGGSPTATTTPTSTASATTTLTPTPTQSPISQATPALPQSLVFQNGISPDPSYDGTTDATITTWGNNSYANCGGWGYLQAGETDSADQFRFLVRFDLDGWLAADAQIEGAWLELRAFDSGYDDRPHDVVAHRVIEEWVEGDGWNLSADGRDEGVTWVTARPGVDWATPGGDFDPVELDRVTVAADPDGWYRWDVTAAVRAWADGTAPNYGLLLEPDSGPWLHHQFRSSEYDDPALRPRLVINLQTACPTDVTGDRSVDLSDVMAVTTRWHRPDLYDPDFDLNGDGGIDVLDIMVVVTRWGLPCGAATSTPTPTITTTPTETSSPTSTATPTTPTATATEHAGGVRPRPDTTDGIHVWNDQLATWNMTEAQFEFAATHYVGSQKIIRSHADRLRAYNPDFLILHYRLGEGLGYRGTDANCNPTGGFIYIVEGDQWVQEWPGEADVQDSWFFPYAGSDRVLQCTWGWYLMELDASSWRDYWLGEVLRQLEANDSDGVFADSLSVPNYLGGSTFEPDLPAYDPIFENAWARRIEDWLAYVKSQFGDDYLLIPNVGFWVTTRNPTDYSSADGVMIEGFAAWRAGSPFALSDWQLQMNRILGLERQNKVVIAQSYLDASDINSRLFFLANYLLVKGVHTYINMDVGLNPEWFPEYEIPIGAPIDGLPADVDTWRDAGSGLYRRTYTNGLVVVNPTDATRSLDLGGTYYRANPVGGGLVPSDGDVSAWRVDYTPVTSLTLDGGRGVVLLTNPPGEESTVTSTPTPSATSSATLTPGPEASATATPTPTATQAPGTLDVPLTVADDAGVARVSDPVTSGVPLPRAANVTDVAQLQLTDADGQSVAAQFTPLARWGGAPDDATKPIKWVLVDFQADVGANGSGVYRLRLADQMAGFLRINRSSPRRLGATALAVNESGSTIEVDTGVARFVISKAGFSLFDQVYLDRDGDGAVDDALLAGPGEIVATTSDGTTYRTDTSAPGEVALELEGTLHAVIRVRGHLRGAGGEELLAYTARLHFYAGQPTARVMFSVWNDNPMVNDGTGQPDITAFGSPNTVLFDDLSLRLQLAGAGPPTYILGGGPGETWTGTLTDTAELYQDSSGGPQWNHEPDNTVNTFRGFRAVADGATLHSACTDADDEDTCRSEGWAGLLASDGGIVAGVRHFWQNYPKAIDLSADGTVTVGLFPGRYSQDFELRVGEQKTHEVLFYFGTEDATGRMTALHNPLRAWASSEYYLNEADAFDRAVPYNMAAFPDFEGYVDAAILYDQMNLLWLRDGGVGSGWVYAPRPEAWGWRNFGDTIAEDETNGDWYPIFTNQQYDHPWVAILQLIRSLDAGDGRADLWWQLAESGARHQADIDIIHSPCTGWPPDEMVACMDAEQGPPYITGWAMGGRLTNQHHADPSPNIHRHALIDYWSGGIRGMLTYYYLTGDGTAKDAWLEMAENARWRVDNSPCDPNCGPGYAHNNPGEGDGRGPAYALEILTDAYAATGNPAYLTSAQRVVAASHPDNTWFGQPGFTLDPDVSPSGRQTSPWSLGMIMKSLGRYLDMTVEWTGTPDPAAQDSLLRYAELQAGWWRLGEASPTCYYFGENGGCTPQAQNYFLADGLAWALIYDDGRADRALWEAVAADAWQKSEGEPWGPGYAKDTFLTAKTHMMHANNGVAWMRYALSRTAYKPAYLSFFGVVGLIVPQYDSEF